MTHHHHHETQSNLTFDEKLTKLLEHWIQHNEAHMSNYMEWAAKAKENNLDQVSGLIENAANVSTKTSEKLSEALNLLKKA